MNRALLVAFLGWSGAATAQSIDSNIRFRWPTDPSTYVMKYVWHPGDVIFDGKPMTYAARPHDDLTYDDPVPHTGTDVKAQIGSNVYAAADGWVKFRVANLPGKAMLAPGFGNHVIIDHGCNVTTIYGHFSPGDTGMPQVGATVHCGDLIGLSGESGFVFGQDGFKEHVHFEVQVNGAPVDPFGGTQSQLESLWTAQEVDTSTSLGYADATCEAMHPPACAIAPPVVAKSRFVTESKPSDNDVVAAGTPFTKTVTIENGGNAAWASPDYVLRYDPEGDCLEGKAPDPMGGPPTIAFAPGESVAPGGQKQFSFDLVAPTTPGTWRVPYRLFIIENGTPTAFGDCLWAQIVVPPPAGAAKRGCSRPAQNQRVDDGVCLQLEYTGMEQCGIVKCNDGLFQAARYDACAAPPILADSCQAGVDYALRFLSELVPDDTKVLPGVKFEKRWHVVNAGRKPWMAASDELVFFEDFVPEGDTMPGTSDTMSGPPTIALPAGASVAPGESLDVSATLTAPVVPGHYIAAWRMQHGGTPFGDYLYTKIEVVASPGTACTVGARDSVNEGACVQSDHAACGKDACGWQICRSGQLVCPAEGVCGGGPYRFPSCWSGDGQPFDWAGFTSGGGGDTCPDLTENAGATWTSTWTGVYWSGSYVVPERQAELGSAALELVSESTGEVALAHTPTSPIDATTDHQLAFAVRGWDLDHPFPPGGAWPHVRLGDGTGRTVTYVPDENQLSSDGITWKTEVVPLGGGDGWTVAPGSDPAFDFATVGKVEFVVATGTPFLMDVDGVAFTPAGVSCAVGPTFAVPLERCNGLDDDGNGAVDDAGACDCRPDTHGGHAYQFCHTQVTWRVAAKACAAMGYHLVHIDDADENAYVQTIGAAWIGLSDFPVEGTWRWQDGSGLSYQPDLSWINGFERENCGTVVGNGRWNDLSCLWLVPFVCEREAP